MAGTFDTETTQMRIDLRSDLLARPSEAMLEAMLKAGREARSYGHREGATVQALERSAARLLGMEDAVLLPTCTMANQAALMAYCDRGDTVMVDAEAHLNINEAASTVGIAGVIMRHAMSYRGHPDPEALERALDEQPSSLIWLENTHNRAGGTVLPAEQHARVIAIARRHGVPVHIDGARLWNAVAATGRAPCDMVAGADSVAVSLNKCLGVPLGAILAGSKAMIARANELRLVLGGGWRSVDMIAAAGLVAIPSLPLEELRMDHAVARQLAVALAAHALLEVDVSLVETNIVYARPRGPELSAPELIARLGEQGILLTPAGRQGVRFVVYRDIREAQVAGILRALDVIATDPALRRHPRAGRAR